MASQASPTIDEAAGEIHVQADSCFGILDTDRVWGAPRSVSPTANTSGVAAFGSGRAGTGCRIERPGARHRWRRIGPNQGASPGLTARHSDGAGQHPRAAARDCRQEPSSQVSDASSTFALRLVRPSTTSRSPSARTPQTASGRRLIICHHRSRFGILRGISISMPGVCR